VTFYVLYIILFVAALILVAACSSKLAGWLNVPVLLLYLLVGMLAKWRFGGALDASNPFIGNINKTANIVGSVALAFILFAGGLETWWRGVRPILFRGGLLASAGVALTALLVGAFTYQMQGRGYTFAGCLLLGAIISSTDAAAVFAVLRGRGVALTRRLQNLLEFESGSNDPMAAFLTLFVVSMLTGTGGAYWTVVPEFAVRTGVGITTGLLCGRVMVRLFNKIDFEYDGLYYVLGIGTVLFTYSVSELVHGNGFMAVYVCGMTMGNSKFMFRNSFVRFHDGICWLMQVMLFTTLGFLVNPGHFGEVWWRAVTVALFLMLVARPLAVFLCLVGSSFSWRERLFISWVGLRGGAPIMLATIPLMAFGKPGGSSPVDVNLVFTVVFLIVILSVLIQGSTLMPLARWLKLDRPFRARPRAPLAFDYTDALKGEMHEFDIADRHAGKRLADLGLPKGALVLLIHRTARYFVPHGHTVLTVGDTLMILAEEPVLAKVWDALNDSTKKEDIHHEDGHHHT